MKEKFRVQCKAGFSYSVSEQSCTGDVAIYRFLFNWDRSLVTEESCYQISWETPMVDFLYQWTPNSRKDRGIGPSWDEWCESSTAYSAPVIVIYDGNGVNRYTWALSECAKVVRLKSGCCEQNGNLLCSVELPVEQYTGADSAELIVRIDTRAVSMQQAAADTALWWETDCMMKPAEVPEYARMPAYSFWYSYHQEMTAESIEAECARAYELGFRICIVDDGWQTEDTGLGYAYCGDWEPSEKKIPDMAAHVARVHQMGMKYLLWFSVSLIGSRSKKYAEFRDKILYSVNEDMHVLDPRYREVREYLIGIYKRALTEWKLDGFKLDFVDKWRRKEGAAPYCDKMDIAALSDAVDTFMTDTLRALREIKPDILVEFRQMYIGPNMRKYGNMFRVTDCPNDAVSNRVGVFDLRMLMDSSAVHSDMLMWHPQERPETAAMQIIGVLFGVLQYSARLEHMSAPMKQMSKFWLGFMERHRKTLLESKLQAFAPQHLYTWAEAVSEKECIAAVYAPGQLVCPEERETIYIANGCMSEEVLIRTEGSYCLESFDCFGNKASEEIAPLSGLRQIMVPQGGLAILNRVDG